MPNKNLPPLPANLPVTEHAVTAWFTQTYGREPNDQEVGAIIDGLAERDASSPRVGPTPDPQGWSIGPSSHPATRR